MKYFIENIIAFIRWWWLLNQHWNVPLIRLYAIKMSTNSIEEYVIQNPSEPRKPRARVQIKMWDNQWCTVSCMHSKYIYIYINDYHKRVFRCETEENQVGVCDRKNGGVVETLILETMAFYSRDERKISKVQRLWECFPRPNSSSNNDDGDADIRSELLGPYLFHTFSIV
jgi:hypothetical protein